MHRKFEILDVMDNLSFDRVKLMRDFSLFPLDSFFELIHIPIFVFEEFAELLREELNVLQRVP